MHFFYLDETGCTGADLTNPDQPIFVLGGISVTDEGWRTTTECVHQTIANFFGNNVPENFELHAADLVTGQDEAYSDRSQHERNDFVHRLLDIIIHRKHAVHFIGI